VSRLGPQPGLNLLDMAGGTGDISFRVMDAIACCQPLATPSSSGSSGYSPTTLPRSSVTVSDINPSMLEVGHKRAVDRGYFSPPYDGRSMCRCAGCALLKGSHTCSHVHIPYLPCARMHLLLFTCPDVHPLTVSMLPTAHPLPSSCYASVCTLSGSSVHPLTPLDVQSSSCAYMCARTCVSVSVCLGVCDMRASASVYFCMCDMWV
jgi:ubiE/COQ5 methyltransferase family